METGAYTLTGNTGLIAVNPGAQIHLPSEDEWYKAAYYQGNGTYSLYPNGQNSITTADANYDGSHLKFKFVESASFIVTGHNASRYGSSHCSTNFLVSASTLRLQDASSSEMPQFPSDCRLMHRVARLGCSTR